MTEPTQAPSVDDHAAQPADPTAEVDPTDPTDADDEARLDEIDRLLGRPRDPDKFAGYLDGLFTMAGRRRITFAILAVVLAAGLAFAAVWAVRNDAGLSGLAAGETDFQSVDSEGFEQREPVDATSEPDLAAADTAVLDQLVAVTVGDTARLDRVVVDPDPALFVVAPGQVQASLLTFRSRPAVALVGPPDWYAGACVEVTVLDPSGEPSAPAWVAAEVGACRGQAGGAGAVPPCVGPSVLVVLLPQVPESPAGEDAPSGSVTVDIFAPSPEYESLLVTGTIAVSGPSARWPAGIADDGTELRLTGLASASGSGEVVCLVS